MPTYLTPGVYIEEQTGPGVIAGVGTSTAAFIGPAVAGSMNVPKFITSYDEFLENYAVPVNGELNPYIPSAKPFYLAHAVQGFFLNGGRQAYIVRVGNGRATEWEVRNNAGEPVFRVKAKREGTGGDSIGVEVKPFNLTTDAGREAVSESSEVTAVQTVNGEFRVTVDDTAVFRVGDVVDKDANSRATVERIEGAVLILSNALTGLAVGDTLKIADLHTARTTVRLKSTDGLFPGSVVLIKGDNLDAAGQTEDHALVQDVDHAGFLTFAPDPARTKNFKIAGLKFISQEFSLHVTPPVGNPEEFEGLSLRPVHPGNVRAVVSSKWVEILPPDAPPSANTYPPALVKSGVVTPPSVTGIDNVPATLNGQRYKTGLTALDNVDDVNMIVIPDASSNDDWEAIQGAMIQHCVDRKDRFAILDAKRGDSRDQVLEHRKKVESSNGRAALYYPWLEVRDPASPRVPLSLYIPPSGHLAGIYARTDQERGVHKAPANTDVRGVFGLETRLNDDQQGKLNEEGINVLRIFQGSDAVIVWGARTTVRKDVTDWRYVNVRRLMLFIEESIEEGIRWAVFEPNGLPLWQQLKRTIREFLTRVWRDGALFGDTADKAFQVRIDEGLNPASVRALGQLYIEIKVAPVRPAEFIIVRIGLWDGGAEVTEG